MAIYVRKRKRVHRISPLRLFVTRNIFYIASIVFVLLFVIGIYRLSIYLKTSEYFSVKRIYVFGTRYSFADDIRDLSGISVGDNIFSFSSARSAEQIKNHPWVKRVSVNKHLPDTVTIEVVEYRPVILINFSQLYLVDESGLVFKRLSEDELFDFPIISGISKEDYLGDIPVYRQKILSLIELKDKFSRLFPDLTLSEILLEKSWDVTLITGKNIFEIRLGQRDYDKKLQRLRIILDQANRSSLNPEIVYLDTNREGMYAMKYKQKK